MCQMGRPPGRRDEPVCRIHFERTLLACERDLQPVEEPRKAAVGLDRALPRPWQRRGVVHGDQAEPKAAIGEPARQVELRNAAAEGVLEVDGGHEQVDPLWRIGADVELERLHPLGQGPRAGVGRDCGSAGLPGASGTLALPPNRPGGSSRRAISPRACRHAMPRSSTPSTPIVSFRPARLLARRSQSQAIAHGERSMPVSSRTARRFFVLIRSPHRRWSTVANWSRRHTSQK